MQTASMMKCKPSFLPEFHFVIGETGFNIKYVSLISVLPKLQLNSAQHTQRNNAANIRKSHRLEFVQLFIELFDRGCCPSSL